MSTMIITGVNPTCINTLSIVSEIQTSYHSNNFTQQNVVQLRLQSTECMCISVHDTLGLETCLPKQKSRHPDIGDHITRLVYDVQLLYGNGLYKHFDSVV